MANEPLYTPKLEYQCDGSTTHYQGCKCYETRWAARLFELRKELVKIRRKVGIAETALEHIKGAQYDLHGEPLDDSDAIIQVAVTASNALALIRRKQGGGAT